MDPDSQARNPRKERLMKQRAKLQVEALEDRTALSAASPYGSLLSPDYALYQPIYGNGSMVQLAGWSASPIFSYYGNGIPYVPDALVMTYTVVNFGSEMSEGTNVVLYGDSPFSSFYGFGPTELAVRCVGPLAPGQAFTETFVVSGDPTWALFGPPILSMSAISLWTPPPPIDFSPIDLLPPIDFSPIIPLPPIQSPGFVVSDPIVGKVPALVGGGDVASPEPLAPLAPQALEQINATAADALGGVAQLLQEQDAPPVEQQAQQSKEEFQGLENSPLPTAIAQQGEGKERGTRDEQLDPDAEPGKQDAELDEAEEKLLLKKPQLNNVPDWLKVLLNEDAEQEDQPASRRDDVNGEEQKESKDVQPAVVPEANPANVPPPRVVEPAAAPPNVPTARQTLQGLFRQAAEGVITVAATAAQAINAEGDQQPGEKLAAERRGNELSEQQAQLAYFILLGTGLSALQQRVKPDKVVEDRDDPRRKRLTRI